MWFGGVIDTSLVSFGNIHENVAYLSSLKGKVVQNLDNYCRSDGELLGKEIEADCFPEINADVFISHSHNDEDYAQRVASWLNSQFGLLPFIDSFVWKSADRLLKIIDDKYCLNDNGKTYSYEARNLSTSYIHMMLASAISKMIDKCPLFIFIKSSNSLVIPEIQECSSTFSPWIFYELLFYNKTKIRIPQKYKNFSKTACLSEAREHLKIEMPVQMQALHRLSCTILNEWSNNYRKSRQDIMPIEMLYKILTTHIEE